VLSRDRTEIRALLEDHEDFDGSESETQGAIAELPTSKGD
jgi:hypothetical protein